MLNLLRQGLRSWSHSEGVAVLAIAALTVGIGSTSAILTVVHAWLLKPLPYANPDDISTFSARGTIGRTMTSFSIRTHGRDCSNADRGCVRVHHTRQLQRDVQWAAAFDRGIVGGRHDHRYVSELHLGDVPLAFTNGVSEAHDPKEDEFGEDRLKVLLRRSAHLPCARCPPRS